MRLFAIQSVNHSWIRSSSGSIFQASLPGCGYWICDGYLRKWIQALIWLPYPSAFWKGGSPSFHSTNLLPGKGPFVNTQQELDVFLDGSRPSSSLLWKGGLRSRLCQPHLKVQILQEIINMPDFYTVEIYRPDKKTSEIKRDYYSIQQEEMKIEELATWLILEPDILI